jgi:hypothetical protein
MNPVARAMIRRECTTPRASRDHRRTRKPLVYKELDGQIVIDFCAAERYINACRE